MVFISKDIKLGDIITFTGDDGQKYLSRVAGLPNQEIKIIDDKISINGELEEWIETIESSDADFEFQEYQSKLPTGKIYQTKKMLKFKGRAFPSQENSNKEIIRIPDNQIFVLGDNRNNSMDSRIYGTILFKNVDKKVNYIWWSKDMKRIGNQLDK